ncbi:MAG: two-component regulator propeller domain-containing protein [Prevotella sp.]|jgi:signal transduction histidine kinase/DNA-binding response OmpR family regulator/ligand-binding sensor domain-containing protein
MQLHFTFISLRSIARACIVVLLILLMPTVSAANDPANNLWTLSTTDGLPNDQTNCIFQDKTGFIWIGTNNGLARYDGFRFKNYYADFENYRTITNSWINSIQQDGNGQLWLKTIGGYCIFDPKTETANRDITSWMRKHSMKGVPYFIHIDKRKNFWIFVYNVGCYYYNTYSGNVKLLKARTSAERRYIRGTVTSISERGDMLLFSLNTGMVYTANIRTQQIDWVGHKLASLYKRYGRDEYKTYISKDGQIFLFSANVMKIYDRKAKRWYEDFSSWCSSRGFSFNSKGIKIQRLIEGNKGNLIIGTYNNGVFLFNRNTKKVSHYLHEPGVTTGLPDNTITDILIDRQGGTWISTLRNGVAYLSPHMLRFTFFPVGDICTITQTPNGLLWLGTNNSGIITFDPTQNILNSANNSVISVVGNRVVTSLHASDGTLWFGTDGGGLVGIKGASKKYFIAQKGQLSNNSVWSLTEDNQHRIVVGTHGGGVQLLDPITQKFTTFNSRNSNLRSDEVTSVFKMENGRILVGHALGFSIIDPRSGIVTNGKSKKNNSPLSSSAVNQVIEDSRGLIWIATMSGLDVYNPKTQAVFHVFNEPKVAASIVEDNDHSLWAAVDHGMVRIKVRMTADDIFFFTSYYDNLDGLQNRQLNFRSIFLDQQGNIVAGGPDGINLIAPSKAENSANHSIALFSGLEIFDQTIYVGQEYDGRVVLSQSLETSHNLRLNSKDNTFTILLASDHVEIPQRARFEYRLLGLNDKWLLTAEGRPSITFTNLSPGHYTLEVKVINRDGSTSAKTSTLEITILPPFWRSTFAIIVYLVLLGAGIWFAYKWFMSRQYRKLKEEQKKLQEARQREISEMKLRFFTNISHEIRTPVALIVSPLKRLLKQETDPKRKETVALILRNSIRLLNIVNQTLEVRKIEKGEERLHLVTGDIMEITDALARSFDMVKKRGITFHYHYSPDTLQMTFDQDKYDKIVMNLLSNAFKYTPVNGEIEFEARLLDAEGNDGTKTEKWFQITVSNSGKNISDEEKTHIFDRYYQTSDNHTVLTSGTGIGLSIVKQYSVALGGNVKLTDREGGGCTFIVNLPYRYDSSLPAPENFNKIEEPLDYYIEDQADNTSSEQPEGNNAIRNIDGSVRYEVLVVDDSSDFRGFMAEQLSEHYRVRTAANGREALNMIEEKEPDIVLSDVMMPEMDGNELCRKVKSNPKTAHLPFVMLTARLSSEYKMEGLSNGADDYITKPFDFDMLQLRMDNLIKWHQAIPQGNDIVDKGKPKMSELPATDRKLLAQATKYVEDNLSNTELSVESMSEALSMSRVHLYKKMLSITGSTPSEFIRNIRLRHAAELLKIGELNVSEVAYKVGFNSPRYFSRYFKDYFGVMPSQYKKADGNVPSDKDSDADVSNIKEN